MHGTAGGTVRAGSAVLAVNTATGGFAGYRLALAVASSHMVITEPVPDVIDELGWTAARRSTTAARCSTTSARRATDGSRSAGAAGEWASAAATAEPRGRSRRRRHGAAALRRFFPQLARPHDHPRLGRPDRRLSHPPADLRLARARHHGFGFTGNGVGPSYLGGEILARLALDRRDDLTGLAIVEPDRKLMPPEPLRWVGGTAIRAALVRRDAAHDRGEAPDAAQQLCRLAPPPPRAPPAPVAGPADYPTATRP